MRAERQKQVCVLIRNASRKKKNRVEALRKARVIQMTGTNTFPVHQASSAFSTQKRNLYWLTKGTIN